jgi:hypothetical protein
MFYLEQIENEKTYVVYKSNHQLVNNLHDIWIKFYYKMHANATTMNILPASNCTWICTFTSTFDCTSNCTSSNSTFNFAFTSTSNCTFT